MQRLIVVYNPNSSQYVHVKDDFLVPVAKLKGFMIGKFAIRKAPFEENLKELKKILKDDDFVIAAGGDATAAVAANAIIGSKKDAVLGVLPYGNFNDLARTLGTMKVDDLLDYLSSVSLKKPTRMDIKKLYPLDISVDGKHWRYATCYVTMGMTAEAVELFDDPKVRKKMQKGHKSSWRSYLQLAGWYFKNRRKKVFVPEFRLNGKEVRAGVSDYCALSGKSMCRVMKGGNDYLKPRVFRSEKCRLINFWRLTKLMAISILKRTPGTETIGDLIEFLEPATVELQAEGEYKIFKDIEKIEVKKTERYLRVIHNER